MIDRLVLVVFAATMSAQAPPQAQAGPIYTATDRGVTSPKLRRQVKPHYTSEALANKVEGSVLLEAVVELDGTTSGVHVLRSLDAGLDEEAIKALAQWQFAPATIDGVAVRMKISVDMAFGISRPSLSMPAAFSPAGADAAAGDATHWTQEQLEIDGLHISLARPAAWTSSPSVSSPLDVRGVDSRGTRRVTIVRPRQAVRDVSTPLSADEIRQMTQSVRMRLSSDGQGALAEAASGQASVGRRLWLWFEGTRRDEHWWMFLTTEQGREVLCLFSTVPRPDATAEERGLETEAAGAEFLNILKRISIEYKPQ